MGNEQFINQCVEGIIKDENPLIPFTMTYAVHEELAKLGFYNDRLIIIKDIFWNRTRRVQERTASREFRYRVHHGSFLTQNTWHFGQHVPEMINYIIEGETS